MLAEALAIVDKTGERFYEAELYRLKGELTLRRKVKSQKSKRKSQISSKSRIPEPRLPLRGRSMLSESHRDCSQATSKVAGAACDDEPRAVCGSSKARRTKLTRC